jgi:hypothetical protein
VIAALIDALLAARPGHALIQFHDNDGAILRELHAVAEEKFLRVHIYANNVHGAHELVVGNSTLVVHDMRGSWRPTEALGDWSPAQHAAQGVVS